MSSPPEIRGNCPLIQDTFHILFVRLYSLLQVTTTRCIRFHWLAVRTLALFRSHSSLLLRVGQLSLHHVARSMYGSFVACFPTVFAICLTGKDFFSVMMVGFELTSFTFRGQGLNRRRHCEKVSLSSTMWESSTPIGYSLEDSEHIYIYIFIFSPMPSEVIMAHLLAIFSSVDAVSPLC